MMLYAHVGYIYAVKEGLTELLLLTVASAVDMLLEGDAVDMLLNEP